VPMLSCKRCRLICRLCGRSPTWSPRFMLSQGALDTPPCRSVIKD
jgi:hypothetical protein